MIGASEAEAQRLAREMNERADTEVGRKRLSGRFGGHDFSHLPLDRPLTPEDFPDPGSVEAARSRTEVIIGLVRQKIRHCASFSDTWRARAAISPLRALPSRLPI